LDGVGVRVTVGVREGVKVLVGVGVRVGVGEGVTKGLPSVPVTLRVYVPWACDGSSDMSYLESMKK
jgi:hypothetical protein